MSGDSSPSPRASFWSPMRVALAAAAAVLLVGAFGLGWIDPTPGPDAQTTMVEMAKPFPAAAQIPPSAVAVWMGVRSESTPEPPLAAWVPWALVVVAAGAAVLVLRAAVARRRR